MSPGFDAFTAQELTAQKKWSTSAPSADTTMAFSMCSDRNGSATELEEMSNVTGLRCVHCARTYSAEEVEYFCPVCGYNDGILDVLYDYESVKRELNASALAENSDLSIWRYLPLLPVNDRTLIPHLQVGWTPLYDAPRLANELGVARCWVKDEGRNPTASFTGS